MPLKAFKCTVDLTIHSVSAPGVRFASKDNLYLNVCLLGQQRRTRLVPALFPLVFDDHLVFTKTFKFCRDPSDVVNLLNGLHTYIELIQLGRNDDDEALAFHETTAKEFLYPIPEYKITYHTAQRDIFMIPSDDFPGAIAPQLQFCTTTKIEETRTPSLDLLKEYEERFLYDPLIDFKRSDVKKKKTTQKLQKDKKIQKEDKSYREHTISSAIKSDYAKPDVKAKLSELNSSVDSRVESLSNSKLESVDNTKSKSPFLVGRVPPKLISRSPSSHKVLNEGLVLLRKSRDRNRKRTKSSKSNNRSLNRSGSQNRSLPIRLARSCSPINNKRENETIKATDNASKSNIITKKYDTSYENCELCANSHGNCEVCLDYKYRTGQTARGNRFHRDETRLNLAPQKDYSNDVRYTNSADYLKKSYNALKDKYLTRNSDYPLNHSFSYYTPPLSRYDWKYRRFFPWYFTYTEYLRELEDELYWLKLRSRLVDY